MGEKRVILAIIIAGMLVLLFASHASSLEFKEACLKSLIPSWLRWQQLVKEEDIVFELKHCNTVEDGTLCTFTITNCGDKEAWLTLATKSYLVDEKGRSYLVKMRALGGSQEYGETGFVQAFFPSGAIEEGRLLFEPAAPEAAYGTLEIVLTGKQWAGDIVKARFPRIRLNK